MAFCKPKRKQLGLVFFLVLFALFAQGIFPCFVKDSFGKTGKKHLLSWESLRQKEMNEKWKIYKRSDRELDVTKHRVVRLKKSSFINTKPFQFAIPAASNSVIYVGVDAGFFYAIDTKKNNKIWTYQTRGPVQSKATINNGIVYFGDLDGYVYALRADNGKEIWKTYLSSPVLTAPVISEDSVYVVANNSSLFELNKNDGQEKWHTQDMPKSLGFTVRRGSSPILYNDLIIFGNSRGTLLAYNKDGSIAWARQIGSVDALVSDVDSSPLINNGFLYVASSDGRVVCIDPNNYGSVVWNADGLGGANDLLQFNNKIYVTGQGILTSIEPQSGQPLWEQDFETIGLSSPVAGPDLITVVSTKSKFYIIDPDTGDILFERYVRRGSFSDPVFIDNDLFILSNSGHLYSFNIKEKK